MDARNDVYIFSSSSFSILILFILYMAKTTKQQNPFDMRNAQIKMRANQDLLAIIGSAGKQ